MKSTNVHFTRATSYIFRAIKFNFLQTAQVNFSHVSSLCNTAPKRCLLKSRLGANLLLAFNSAKSRKSTRAFRHNANQETPVAIYIAFLIHSKTRSEDLVNRLHSLGLCISYDRLSTLSTYLGNSVIDQCDKDGLVCPSSLRCNLFTTQAVDNIDHNPSSRTAKDLWHGTVISTSQHLKNKDDGTIQQPLDLQENFNQSY